MFSTAVYCILHHFYQILLEIQFYFTLIKFQDQNTYDTTTMFLNLGRKNNNIASFQSWGRNQENYFVKQRVFTHMIKLMFISNCKNRIRIPIYFPCLLIFTVKRCFELNVSVILFPLKYIAISVILELQF